MANGIYKAASDQERGALKNQVRRLADALRDGNCGGIGPTGYMQDSDIDGIAKDVVAALDRFGYVDAVVVPGVDAPE